jgi:hypothetical protein
MRKYRVNELLKRDFLVSNPDIYLNNYHMYMHRGVHNTRQGRRFSAKVTLMC